MVPFSPIQGIRWTSLKARRPDVHWKPIIIVIWYKENSFYSIVALVAAVPFLFFLFLLHIWLFLSKHKTVKNSTWIHKIVCSSVMDAKLSTYKPTHTLCLQPFLTKIVIFQKTENYSCKKKNNNDLTFSCSSHK